MTNNFSDNPHVWMCVIQRNLWH